MTCCVYSFDGMCPCMDDERWSCGAKICLEICICIITVVLQRTMIGSEDKVANNPLTINIVPSMPKA